MWQLDTRLPPFTNREDTLEPIDLSGITLANTGANFTASAWTVTDGTIVTSSSTSITIPMFPVIGANDLAALSLVVTAGLGIKAGDPINIKDTTTGRSILNGYVTSYSANTGVLVVQIGWTFQFEISRGGPAQFRGYIPWWDGEHLTIFPRCSPRTSAKATVADRQEHRPDTHPRIGGPHAPIDGRICGAPGRRARNLQGRRDWHRATACGPASSRG